MNKQYDVEYFYNKFNKIPDEKWITGSFRDPVYLSKRCALGHCGANYCMPTPMGRALINIFEEGFKSNLSVSHVNDAYNPNARDYPQELGSTPKERVLNALVLIGSGILEEVE